jgi:DNA-binding Lrp family transcriptional regulator
MLDAVDRALINALQAGLPLAERPFAAVAASLGLSEEAVVARLGAMLAQGTLSRFGPMYNADRMGGAFALCAMAVPQDRFAQVAGIVNAYPEVAHNYERAHALNMWFVIAVERPERIGEVVTEIKSATGLETYAFPKLEEFFIGLRVEA